MTPGEGETINDVLRPIIDLLSVDWTDFMLMLFGVIGLALALWAAFRLYEAAQGHDERSSTRVGFYILNVVIGSLLTMVAIVVGSVSFLFAS